MRLGSDALKLPGAHSLPAPDQVDDAARHGLAGLFFRTMLHMSPNLDLGLLREVRARADAHGMYLESGLGKVNPYALAETPEIRAAGDGDTVLGFRRMMEAATRIGVTELWVSTGGAKPYGGRFGYDRYRTDAPWEDQLVAIEKLLHHLAPIARDLGVHINAETHEEITSFELVRLVHSVGADVMGITYDIGNPLQRLEDPILTTQRIAPYVRQTHVKDVVLTHDPRGLRMQVRPVGQGMIDLHQILPVLYRENPSLNLSLEINELRTRPAPGESTPAPGIALYDPVWLGGHPDLTVDELVRVLSLVQQFEGRVATGQARSVDDFGPYPTTIDQAWEWVTDSLASLRSVMCNEGIPEEGLHAGD